MLAGYQHVESCFLYHFSYFIAAEAVERKWKMDIIHFGEDDFFSSIEEIEEKIKKHFGEKTLWGKIPKDENYKISGVKLMPESWTIGSCQILVESEIGMYTTTYRRYVVEGGALILSRELATEDLCFALIQTGAKIDRNSSEKCSLCGESAADELVDLLNEYGLNEPVSIYQIVSHPEWWAIKNFPPFKAVVSWLIAKVFANTK